MEKVFTVFKVTLPVVGGWIKITCLSYRTTLHLYLWKRYRHSSTPSEVPRSHSGGLAKCARHNREISALQNSPPRGWGWTLHIPDSLLSGRLSTVTVVLRRRSHWDRGPRVLSLVLEKLFSSVQMSSHNTEKARRSKAEGKDSLRRPKLLSELTGEPQKYPNVSLTSEISWRPEGILGLSGIFF